MECHDLHGCLQVKWCGPYTELSDYQTMQKYQSTEGPPQLHDRVEGSFSQLFVYPVQPIHTFIDHLSLLLLNIKLCFKW